MTIVPDVVQNLTGVKMSSDFINRQALCDDLREYKIHPVRIFSDKSEIKGYNDGIDLAISVISKFSSTELERKKGEWIYDEKRGRFPACKCSICGHYENADWAILQGVNFCPHCGADMRGE